MLVHLLLLLHGMFLYLLLSCHEVKVLSGLGSVHPVDLNAVLGVIVPDQLDLGVRLGHGRLDRQVLV